MCWAKIGSFNKTVDAIVWYDKVGDFCSSWVWRNLATLEGRMEAVLLLRRAMALPMLLGEGREVEFAVTVVKKTAREVIILFCKAGRRLR